MPRAIGAFARQHPRARINCHELDHKQLIEGLLQGLLEIAVTYDMAMPEQLKFKTISQYPAYALVPPNHPLARRDHAYLRQLAGDPMILLDLPHTAEYFQSIFLHLGIKPQIRYRTPSPHMARALVANGLGYTLLNAPLKNDRSLDGKVIRAIRLDDDLPALTLGIAGIQGHRLTRVAGAFVDQLLAIHPRVLAPRLRRGLP
jgi:DNA-binding transcriptional LysR family regulator